jgi:prepilin-type N-terminal cleavage/methylation domain-containing protein
VEIQKFANVNKNGQGGKMKRGFTLIELLVYMAIMGFIIVVAGRVFSDSTVMRVRSQNMLKSSEVIGRISDLIKEDISQMGVKAWGEDEFTINLVPEVYWNLNTTPHDSSSYALFREDKGDSLVFRKADFDVDGKLIGVREIYLAVDTIAKELRRGCVTISNTRGPGDDIDREICPDAADVRNAPGVVISKNITKFRLIPSIPREQGNSVSIDPDDPDLILSTAISSYKFASRNDGGADGKVRKSVAQDVGIDDKSSGGDINISVTGFKNSNSDEKQYSQIYLIPSDKSEWKECSAIQNIKKNETYVVEFKMPFNEADNADTLGTQMRPGEDHIAIGFREQGNGEEVTGISNDVLFYPPQHLNAVSLKRHAEFSIGSDYVEGSKICLAITFAFYSKNSKGGRINFSEFKIFRKKDESFHFDRNSTDFLEYGAEKGSQSTDELLRQKKDVKAFELVMEVDIKGEKIATDARVKDEIEKRGMIIATPNNGM